RNRASRALALTPDGGTMVSWSYQDVRLHAIPVAKERLRINLEESHKEVISHMSLSPDGRTLALITHRASRFGPVYEGGIRIWNLDTGKELHSLRGKDWYWGITFSPDGRMVAAGGSSQNTVHVWETTTGQEILKLSGHRDWVMQPTFSADGRM